MQLGNASQIKQQCYLVKQVKQHCNYLVRSGYPVVSDDQLKLASSITCLSQVRQQRNLVMQGPASV